jgi:hypothetical protein
MDHLGRDGLPRGLGFDVITDSEIRPDAFLFGEAQGRVVVTVNEDRRSISSISCGPAGCHSSCSVMLPKAS